MQTYKMKVADENKPEGWWEAPKQLHNAKGGLQKAVKIAKQIVEDFNRTLRPYEKPRRFLGVERYDPNKDNLDADS